MTLHGAPSARWGRAQARNRAIVIKGPRGGRYVDRTALADLLEKATVKRAPAKEPAAVADVVEDAKSAVAELVAKRAKKAAA